MNTFDKSDCESNIKRIRELIGSGIFNSDNRGHVLFHSAFIELMICLRDLIEKTQTYARRISFTDDVLTNAYVKDVHDAIVALRDACCHIDSWKKYLNKREYRASFLVIYGRGSLVKIGDIDLRSDYEDELTFFHGTNRLYMRRHIIRVFDEAVALLTPLLSEGSLSNTTLQSGQA